MNTDVLQHTQEKLEILFEPEVIVVPATEFDIRAANIVVELLQEKPTSSLIVPTGSTPEEMYRLLSEASRLGVISFEQATLFNLDEYVIDTKHPGSYTAFMERHLFANLHTNLPEWYIPRGDAENPHTEAEAFESLIREHVRQRGLIDLAIVGIGPSGAENVHIAFNEPGVDSHRYSVSRVSEIPKETAAVNRALFAEAARKYGWDDSEVYPTQTITMGVSTILDNSARLLVLVKGKEKALGVKRMLEGEVGWQCPASYIRCHPHVTVLLDEAAFIV